MVVTFNSRVNFDNETEGIRINSYFTMRSISRVKYRCFIKKQHCMHK